MAAIEEKSERYTENAAEMQALRSQQKVLLNRFQEAASTPAPVAE